MDYVMPRADLVPAFRAADLVMPSPGNKLGAKGAGEAGTTGAGAACLYALISALRSVGVASFEMPATPARIWAAMQAASLQNQP
jgi:carbon-monoxide dehydrogenase large subunit